MSYSFSVRAATKLALLACIAAKFDEVLIAQPAHAADRAVAEASAAALVNVLPEPTPGKEFYVTISGWISYRQQPDLTASLSGVNFSINASFADVRPAEVTPAPSSGPKGNTEA